MRTFVILIAFSLAAFGQRHKASEEVDAEKPEGKLLQQCHAGERPRQEDRAAGAVRRTSSRRRADAVGAGATPGVLREGQSAGPDHRGGRQAAGGRSRTIRRPRCRRSRPRRRRRTSRWSGSTPTSTLKNARKIAAAPQPKEADAGGFLEAGGGVREAGGAVRGLRAVPRGAWSRAIPR